MENLHGLVLLCLVLLTGTATATTQFKVGGSKGWTMPTGPNAMSFNQWAEQSRFKIGDSLLFVYPPGQDSVLQVDKEAYTNCNTLSYIKRFDDGNTVFTLDRSGTFYFISGVEGNCLKNESLVVVVLADRSNRALVSSQPGLSPPPSPPSSSPPPSPAALSPPTSEVSSPPPPSPAALSPPTSEVSSPPPPSPAALSPPTSEVSSPPPTSEVSSPPAPPPSGSTEVAPSASPVGEEFSPPPPPNGASLKLMGFMGSVGALIGSILPFVL